MINIRVIIADEDNQTRETVKKFITALPYIALIGEAPDEHSVMEIMVRERPDLILTDPSQPGLGGLKALKDYLQIVPRLKMIWMASGQEYAIEAFNMGAVDYIIKPVLRTRLYKALERTKHNLEMEQKANHLFINPDPKLIIKINKNIHIIPFNEILFIEKMGKKSIIHTLNNDPLETYDKLEPAPHLVQAHRSYLINLSKVSRITRMGETYQSFFGSYPRQALIAKSKMKDIQEQLLLRDPKQP
ncbi:LytR/AlgR family response regulator transcription factor [Paenibacillus sepulcri]|uniref:LytTR family DNA-binding domain-containing protein n=1 Tax=Paenibacillus sepulcri TaxID=359917 RepID=A0ABS7C7G0_9BACL|nr:LytTR family DNA-binding domain-containing protein [Paenibacillus sepulcri]